MFEAGLLSYKKKSNNLPREESSTSLSRGWLKLLRVNILGFLQLHRLYDLFGRKSLPPYWLHDAIQFLLFWNWPFKRRRACQLTPPLYGLPALIGLLCWGMELVERWNPNPRVTVLSRKRMLKPKWEDVCSSTSILSFSLHQKVKSWQRLKPSHNKESTLHRFPFRTRKPHWHCWQTGQQRPTFFLFYSAQDYWK